MTKTSPDMAVLIVDDDLTSRFLAEEALAGMGFTVHTADDGEQALRVFHEVHPEIILLDVIMPNMDGYTACEQIRQQEAGRHIPILMLTGLDDITSIDRAYEVGATDFITKPVNTSLLIHRIRYIQRATHTADNLRLRETQLANAQRIARLGYWKLNLSDQSLHLSDEILTLLGYTDASSGFDFAAFLNVLHPEDRSSLEESLSEIIESGEDLNLDLRILHADGSLKNINLVAEKTSDSADKPILTGTMQDITEKIRSERQIRNLSYYDKVTGLPNRLMFKRQVARALSSAQRFHRMLSVVTLNLDHFKRVNETFGIAAGDILLKQVAARLVDTVRSNDLVSFTGHQQLNELKTVVAHFGGDEFVLLLEDMHSAEDAAVVANRITRALGKEFDINQSGVCITASMGISVYPDDGKDADQLMKQSVAALYHSKDEGRQRYNFYTPNMNARAFERMSLESSLRKALEDDQFELYYQPKVSIDGSTVVGTEALLRWQHPEFGTVSPAKFIPIAEESGLIVPIGEWVIRRACQQIKQWQEKNMPRLRVAVNLSAQQFSENNLDTLLTMLLNETGIDASCLELEITETLMMADLQNTTLMLKKLTDLGLHISIDDFGTGYSSLSYLKKFPLHTLKIDQSFIRDLMNDPDDAAIVRAIISLAHNLRLNVIAEGVENIETLEFLQQQKCDEVQGYLYSPPLPADKFEAWLCERNSRACA